MDTKALRQKILDLAIRGKLVPQDPNDEPASVLLERIRAQKQQMVKEGKLKAKDIKNDTVIFVGEDNLHYEKYANGTVKCIEDEIPFDLPEGWEWGRTISLCIINPRNTLPDNMEVSFIPMPRIAEGYLNQHTTETRTWGDVKSGFTHFANGDVGVAKITPCFENRKSVVFSNLYNGYGAGTTELHILRPLPHSLLPLYILYQMKREDFIQQGVHSFTGAVGQQRIGKEFISRFLIPVPPYEEQKRIVEQISNAFKIIDCIDSDQNGLWKALQQSKSKICDLAIRGYLVPQNPDDEPAAALLERIRAEKKALAQQGLIKRDKRESIIFRGDDNSYYERVGTDVVDITEELPFSIPETWCWARMSTLFEINPRNKLDDSLEVSFIPMPLIEDGYSGNHGSEKRKWSEVRTGFMHFAEGDIGIAKITPCFENRKSVVFQKLTNGFGAGTTELHVLRPYGRLILPEYALALVKTKAFIEDGKQEFTGAVGQQRIGKDFISEYLFPIPPYQEQERIVNAIEQIFHIINEIEQSIG